jgi:short-subunit dehydrogenase
MNLHPITLVTGASSGIGLHLAREFARNGHSLALVAPVAEEVKTACRDIEKEFHVEAIGIPADLTIPLSIRQIQEELEWRSVYVNILVNNAGVGYRGKSWEIDLDRTLSMLRLNVEAMIRLTHAFLPAMVERDEGRVLNTASVAGFEAGPHLNVYHATKAFVLSWSEGLSLELEETGVSVSALCPGPTDTDFFPKAGMEDVRAFQSMKVMAPQEVAQAGYRGVMNGDMIIIPGLQNKVMVAGRRLLTEHAQAKLNQRMYEKVPVGEVKHHRGEWETAFRTRDGGHQPVMPAGSR